MPKNKLKILLVNVPEVDFTERKISYREVLLLKTPPIPLGIASLSAYMKRMSNHEIYIYDAYVDGYSSYKENKDKDILLELLEKKINTIMPDVIGISALMIVNYKWVHHIAHIAKGINPQVKIIVGGGYASLMPQRILDDISIDFIVLGEGEESFLTIINENFTKEKISHLDGIGFRDESGEKIINRKSSFISDVNTLPFFDWKGIKLENYLQHSKDRTVPYVTSRGCPFACSFCSTYLMWGKKFRPFSAQRILDEIDYLVSEYSVGHIEFRDDNITLDKTRALDIFNEFVKRGYNFKWTCPNAMAISALDQNLLEIIKKSGCDTIIIAIESGSERVIKDIIHKPVDKNKVRDIIKASKDLGLKIHTAFIVGFPGETKADIEETRNFILELQCDWNQISIATPFPGTEMYDICEKNNYFVNSNLGLERFRYGFANIRTDDFDEEWIKEKAYDINIEVNFLKNHNFNDDPQQAIVEFNDRLASYPKHLIAIFCLAYAYKKAGENKKAQDTLRRACDLIKDEPDIRQTYKKYIDPINPIFEDYFKLLEEHDTEKSNLNLLKKELK